jgi:hypothetical protein
VASAGIALRIRLTRALERRIGISVGLDLRVVNGTGCRLVMQLRVDRLRRGRPDYRVRGSKTELPFELADLHRAWSGVRCRCGEKQHSAGCGNCRFSQDCVPPNDAHVELLPSTSVLKLDAAENVRLAPTPHNPLGRGK